MKIISAFRKILNKAGFDVIRLSGSPKRTLLGLAGHKFGTIIDVGANTGQFAREISKFFPNAQMYCFEPLDGPFKDLLRWASTQGNRVKCFNTAVGEFNGEAQIHQHDDHTSSSSLLAATKTCHDLYPQTKSEHLETIKVSTLDDALTDSLDQMPKGILLKLDVQGFEDRVLRGGARVLSYCAAVILEVSIESLYHSQADFLELSRLLYNAGYKYAGNLAQAYGDDGRAIFIDAVFIRSQEIKLATIIKEQSSSS